jgi:capsular polysaccharide biosynthesis protein/Mrp family chromosome partitioning ATPase
MTRIRRAPGWQLSLLFIGYPVWWLLGIVPFVMVVATAWLAIDLWHRRPLRIPAGFSFWLLFLVWVVLGILVVQTNAPLSVVGLNVNRYLTWGIRLLYYLQATVVLLYVVNLRERAALARVLNAFAWMFVWVVAGGLLGTLLPHVDFPSLFEVALPHRYAASAFVRSMVHPNLVEHMLATGDARPSAPFPYANVWGLNFACFLPCFVRSWLGSGSPRRRAVAVVVLMLSVIPVVTSLNRGLWLALALALLTVVVRLAFDRRARLLILTTVSAVVAVVALAVTPLGATVSHRLDSPNSNQGRSELAIRGFTSTLASPVVGYGTTRDVQGSLSSIAGGATTSCPRCSPPSFGTQGQLFLITFAQGFVGGVFYLAFVLLMLVRGFRIRGPDVTMASAILVMHLSTLAVYSADNLAILPIFLSLGVIGRELELRRVPGATRVPWLWSALRARPRVAMATVALGLLGGLVWHVAFPPPVTMSTSVVLPDAGQDGAATGSGFPATTLDTLAQMVSGENVTREVAAATGASPESVSGRLGVTAIPNTRIVNLQYTDPSAAVAKAGSTTAAQALLAVRRAQLDAQHGSGVRAAKVSARGLAAGVLVTRRSVHAVRSHQRGPVTRGIARQLTQQLTAVTTAWDEADDARSRLELDVPLQGALTHVTHEVVQPVPWGEPTANGIAAALVIAAGIGMATRRKSRFAVLPVPLTSEADVKTSNDHNPRRGTMDRNRGEAHVARLEPRGQLDRGVAPPRPVVTGASAIGLDSLTSVLRRRRLSFLITFLVVVLLGGAYSVVHGSTYTSTTTVFLQPITGNALSTSSSSNSQALTVAMQTEANLVDSQPVIDEAANTLGRDLGPVTATVPQNTQILRIAYTGTSRGAAKAGASAVATAFLDYRSSVAQQSITAQTDALDKQISTTRRDLKAALAKVNSSTPSTQANVDVQLLTTRLSGLTQSLAQVKALSTGPGSVVKAATAGRAPILGRTPVLLVGTILLGLVAGLGVALLRDRMDDRLRLGRDPSVAGLPVLTKIAPHDHDLSDFVDGLDPGDPMREAYRQARAGVLASTDRPSVITVTPFAGSGLVSYIGCNLALALSEAGYRVRIVDASLEREARPDFPTHTRAGLAEHLISKQSRELTLGLWHRVELLPAGKDLGSVRDLFSSERMSGLVDRLSKVADYVVVLAPEAATAEAVALAAVSDATVMVGREGHTTQTDVREQAARYRGLGADVIGLIVLDEHATTRSVPAATPVVASADEET